jgi:hypothetical protein
VTLKAMVRLDERYTGNLLVGKMSSGQNVVAPTVVSALLG